ncbi:polysaccharide deacetylase family protein [Alteromonas sp. 14N.309.X.WAT.G.H12]|uniref:polysaccharide deacetylase family protein n=1 Tax=Alteromonas sp. 14N.309.X.WAT.G.H12 TaxID=3120824 RepID=UPI002FD59521
MSLTNVISLLGKVVKWRFNPHGHSAVLYFHRVLTEPDPYYPDDPTANELDSLFGVLKKSFNIVSLREIAEKRVADVGEKPLLGISFDDGYLDNYSLARPILNKHNIKATFFISTVGTREGMLWQDKVIECVRRSGSHNWVFEVGSALDGMNERSKINFLMERMKRLDVGTRETQLTRWSFKLGGLPYPVMMMNDSQVKRLSDEGHDIGGHTHNHVILKSESLERVEKEVTENRDYLERLIGKKVDLFCYPNGHPFHDIDVGRHPEMLRRLGFRYAFTTQDGGVEPSSDPMLLPRFLPYRKNPYLLTLSAMKIAGENV